MNRSLHNLSITLAGLGLHGGGLETVRWLVNQGANVTVTDLRSSEILRPALDKLEGIPLTKRAIGYHNTQDFVDADIVVKNPAVPRESPYLKGARRIETDISLFLAYSRNPIIAVTGTKGKSTVASAIYTVLHTYNRRTLLGGNIGTSPLTFLDQLRGDEPIVLELSSFQLGDLPLCESYRLVRPWPRVAVITNLFPDHLDRYPSFEEYANDKRQIYYRQSTNGWLICPEKLDVAGFKGQAVTIPEVSSFSDGELEGHISPNSGGSLGRCFGYNMRIASMALAKWGLSAEKIGSALRGFRSLPHRLEWLGAERQISFYNDSASTVPQATMNAVESLCSDGDIILIAGGSDKNGDMTLFPHIFDTVKHMILLSGTATNKIEAALRKSGRNAPRPFDSLSKAVLEARGLAQAGDIILLSPGCASFGMFRHEYDRGDQFRHIVLSLIAEKNRRSSQ